MLEITNKVLRSDTMLDIMLLQLMFVFIWSLIIIDYVQNQNHFNIKNSTLVIFIFLIFTIFILYWISIFEAFYPIYAYKIGTRYLKATLMFIWLLIIIIFAPA
jgi:hypothetical protein